MADGTFTYDVNLSPEYLEKIINTIMYGMVQNIPNNKGKTFVVDFDSQSGPSFKLCENLIITDEKITFKNSSKTVEFTYDQLEQLKNLL